MQLVGFLQFAAALVLLAEMCVCVVVGAAELLDRFPDHAPRAMFAFFLAAAVLLGTSGCASLKYSALGCRPDMVSMLDPALGIECARLFYEKGGARVHH